ncbi:DinB family protein [Kribbella sp. NBC_01505]|uniref:DinB family protein n=1 Tax=Kribbella sp. NBC_01505 TaxID=2903580 RepID=UPI00386B6206
MDVDWGAEVVDQLEAHWRDQLRPRLDGLTDDEYFWQPAPEPVTTIAWRLAHVCDVLASTSSMHFGRAATTTPTYPYAGSAQEALRQLDDEYALWIAGVRGLGMAGLSEPQGAPPAFAEAPVAKLMLYINVEVIHHGAEICLLRDLYLQKT